MTRTTDDGCTHGSWWGSGCITVIAPYGHAAQCCTIKKWLVSQRKIPDADDAGEVTLMYCWEESSLWSWPVCHCLLWRRVALGEELPEQSLTTSGLQVFLFSPNALAENPTPACPLKLLFNLGVIQQILISWFTFPVFFSSSHLSCRGQMAFMVEESRPMCFCIQKWVSLSDRVVSSPASSAAVSVSLERPFLYCAQSTYFAIWGRASAISWTERLIERAALIQFSRLWCHCTFPLITAPSLSLALITEISRNTRA